MASVNVEYLPPKPFSHMLLLNRIVGKVENSNWMSFLSGRGRNGLLRPPPPPKVVIPPIKVNDINSAARQAKRHFIWRAALERKLSRTGFTIQRSSAAGRLVEIQLPVDLYTGWKIMTHSVNIHCLFISQNWQFQIFSNCNFYAQLSDHSSYLVTSFL